MKPLVFALLATLSAVAAEAETPKSKLHPFLWEIGDGATKSFIYGTIHLSRPEVLAMAPEVETALESSDAVFTEIPMDPATILGMMPRMLLPDGKTLADVLPESVYKSLASTLAGMDPSMTVDPFERFKIWAVAATLGTMDSGAASGGIPLDMLIFQQAAMEGKTVGGLETVDEQIAIFEGLSEDQQVLMLSETLTLIDEGNSGGESPIDSLVSVYLSGDIDALGVEFDRWMAAGDPVLGDQLRERLLTARNQLMAERIAEKIRSNPDISYFFAVGAGHLFGDDGIPALLEADGIPLRRIGAPPR